MSRVLARLERAGHVEPGARHCRSPPAGDRSYVARLGGFCQSPGRGVSDQLVERWIDDPQQFRAELVRLVSAGGPTYRTIRTGDQA